MPANLSLLFEKKLTHGLSGGGGGGWNLEGGGGVFVGLEKNIFL